MTGVFAHRGIWTVFPENTRPAFLEALRRGYSIETDLRRTKDGHIVVIHDPSTPSRSGIALQVAETTLDDLRRVDLGNPKTGTLRIMSLEDLLELFIAHADRGQQLALQMKSHEADTPGIIAKIISLFAEEDARLFERVFVFDLTREAAAAFRTAEPRLRLGHSLGEDAHFPDKRYPTIRTRAQLDREDDYDIVWGDEWATPLYTEALVRSYRTRMKAFIAISPELHGTTAPPHPDAGNVAALRARWHDLVSWGVDGICTDFTEDVREIIEAHRED